ncbi:MAG: hypothetical protein MUO26_01160 [Methanotrichaceae archaeon]|nr:hypothetical protein [Methanotrichaceae archaeon]
MLPKLITDELLNYAQVIKHRVRGSMIKAEKRAIFGKNIDLKRCPQGTSNGKT